MPVARPDADSAGPSRHRRGHTVQPRFNLMPIDGFASDDASHDPKYWLSSEMEPVSQSSVLTVPGNWGNGNGEWRMEKAAGKWSRLSTFQGGTVQSIRRRRQHRLVFLSFSFPWTKGTEKKRGTTCKDTVQGPTMHQRIYPSADSSEPRKTRQPKAIQKPHALPLLWSIPLEMNSILFHSCSVSSFQRLSSHALVERIAATQPTRRQ